MKIGFEVNKNKEKRFQFLPENEQEIFILGEFAMTLKREGIEYTIRNCDSLAVDTRISIELREEEFIKYLLTTIS